MKPISHLALDRRFIGDAGSSDNVSVAFNARSASGQKMSGADTIMLIERKATDAWGRARAMRQRRLPKGIRPVKSERRNLTR